MQGWYEFGYHGFPTGERRKRFYRQRDDPCDSDDEQRAAHWDGVDDETNDRPEYHYPMRDSEAEDDEDDDDDDDEGVSTCSDADVCGERESDGSDDAVAARCRRQRRTRQQQQRSNTTATTMTTHVTDDDDDDSVDADRGATTHTRRRRRQRRHRTATAAAVPALVQCTLHEDMPAWYGSSVVTFVVHDTSSPTTTAIATTTRTRHADALSWRARRFALYHGGASCATHTVTHHSHLIECVSSSRTHDAHARHDDDDDDDDTRDSRCDVYVPVARCAALRAWLLRPSCTLHATLRRSVCGAPRRFGHCAVALGLSHDDTRAALQLHSLPSSLPLHTTTTAADVRHAHNDNDDSDDVPTTLHLSLIVGGVSCATPLRGGSAALRTSSLLPHLQLTTSTASASHHTAACPLALCMTLLRCGGSSDNKRPDDTTATPACYDTVYCPLALQPATASHVHEHNDADNDDNNAAALPCCVFATATLWPASLPSSSWRWSHTADAAKHDDNDDTKHDGEAYCRDCCIAVIGGVGADLVLDTHTPHLVVRLLRLHLRTWRVTMHELTTYGATPAARFGHTTTSDEAGCLFVFGGVGSSSSSSRGGGAAPATRYLNDLHVLDARTCVWRQVYTPLDAAPPCRAFHSAAVVCAHGDDDDGRRPRGDDADGDLVQHVLRHTYTTTATAAAAASSLYSSSPLRARRCCVWLVVVGGESATGAEASVCLYPLRAHACNTTHAATATAAVSSPSPSPWQRCTFPLLHVAACYHVATAARDGDAGRRSHTATYTAQTRLCHVVRMLVHERDACASAAATDARVRHDYVAACHGALAQLLSWPSSPSSLWLLGGASSVAVVLASQLTMSDCSVRQRAAFWCLAAHTTAPATTTTTSSTTSSLLAHALQRSGCLAAVAREVCASATRHAAAVSPTRVVTSRCACDADATAFANVLHEQQLLHWTRTATQRLSQLDAQDAH